MRAHNSGFLSQSRAGFNPFAIAPVVGVGYYSHVKSARTVKTPPAKPVLFFDGNCTFCLTWIRRWKQITGAQVEYLAFQDQAVNARFPEIPLEDFEEAVHLVETDGSVYRGAEAAFRALAQNPHKRQLLDWYKSSAAFASASERAYAFSAGHRKFFSALTRVLWGREVEAPTHRFVQWLFLRCLASIYVVAFLSLWVQVTGLIGSNGILPAKLTMTELRREAENSKLGWNRFHLVPTLCWASASDSCLKLQCAAGVC